MRDCLVIALALALSSACQRPAAQSASAAPDTANARPAQAAVPPAAPATADGAPASAPKVTEKAGPKAPKAAANLPLGYSFKPELPQGQKPQIRLQATQNISGLRIEFVRDDGKRFKVEHGDLTSGQAAILPIGDGEAGRFQYQGTMSGKAAGRPWRHEFTFATVVRSSLKVGYDAQHLDLDKRTLQFTLSRPTASASLVIIGDDGSELGRASAEYRGEAPGTWLAITWKQKPGRVMKLLLRVKAKNGLATRVELVPWSVAIDHDDLEFAMNSSDIDSAEEPKLKASLAKIAKVIDRSGRFMPLKLYIAGHTDTVGSAKKNRALSRRRARAIADYMRAHGVAIPIAVAGFGEEVLKVKTKDNTDMRANRRVDYVLGPASGAPPFGARHQGTGLRWRELP